MAVVVLQKDKDMNFIKMLRVYLSCINMSGVTYDLKKKTYFVTPSIRKKLKSLEAARKIPRSNRINKNKMNKSRINKNRTDSSKKISR